ncbi:MAG: hypothetical protein CL866_08050 [Cycloclasticus sp.]|nr:hypothetical protein [Cycloclasticus sp.]MBG96796.1 hypothetical protein [Cycloclasticus sp.]HAI96350.1 hypothetical protein [Methylococcaceae bacterium]
MLASSLSIRPETFSRILKQLTHDRLIEVKDKTMTILGIDALRVRL